MRSIFLIAALCSAFGVQAQTASDALRFSRLDRNGGARHISVMGSLGALGADFGVVSSNPAGLATFRRSEFFFTPGLYHTGTEARLLGGSNGIGSEGSIRFHVQNGGFVKAAHDESASWKAVNFAIGFTQLANYNEKLYWDGYEDGSVTDRWRELADGIAPDALDEFEAGPAWDAGAIYDPEGKNFYVTDFDQAVPGASRLVEKRQYIDRKGYQNELQFALAGNYLHKLFLGAAVGVPLLQFEEFRSYEETDLRDTIPFFNSLVWDEELQTSGVGINLRLGIAYRPFQALRLGVAVHTPTVLALTDDYSKKLTYSFIEGGQSRTLEGSSPQGVFDYRLRTPWRLLADAGYIVGKSGFLSAEVEWVDYSSASFNFTPDVSSAEYREAERKVNRAIAESFRGALQVRFGGEWSWNIFRFRGGLGLFGTEYANDTAWSRAWSAGLGIREESFYIDLGFRRQIREEGLVPYETSAAPELFVNTRQVRDLFALTLGIKL